MRVITLYDIGYEYDEWGQIRPKKGGAVIKEASKPVRKPASEWLPALVVGQSLGLKEGKPWMTVILRTCYGDARIEHDASDGSLARFIQVVGVPWEQAKGRAVLALFDEGSVVTRVEQILFDVDAWERKEGKDG